MGARPASHFDWVAYELLVYDVVPLATRSLWLDPGNGSGRGALRPVQAVGPRDDELSAQCVRLCWMHMGLLHVRRSA